MNPSNQHVDDSLREQLSALMDGELPRDQALFLLKRMERDESLRHEWERLHNIRDGINAVTPTPVSACNTSVPTCKGSGACNFVSRSPISCPLHWTRHWMTRGRHS